MKHFPLSTLVTQQAQISSSAEEDISCHCH